MCWASRHIVLHCVFRHDCVLVPNQCPFLDDRTPEHKLSMEFSCRGERGMYDCGWLYMPSIGHVAVLVKDLGQYMSLDKDAQINVVVNNPDGDEDTIDLGRVFHNARLMARVYAWVVLLCFVAGLSGSLLLNFVLCAIFAGASAWLLDKKVDM